jgi:O-antigen ligase
MQALRPANARAVLVGPPTSRAQQPLQHLPAADQTHGRRQTLITTATSLFLLGWWLVQQGQDFLTAITPAPAPAPGRMTPSNAAAIVSATESGSVLNTLLIVAFAIVGGLHLYRSRRLIAAPRIRLILALLGVYLGWALLSTLWSVDAGLTIRRYTQLLLVVIGSAGLGLGFYGISQAGLRMFAQHVVIAGCVSTLIVWAAIVANRDVDILDPAWEGAKGFGLGTTIIFPISFMAFTLVWMAPRYLSVRWSVLGALICVLSLLVIKGRHIAAFAIGLTLLLPLFQARLTWRRVLPYLVAVGLSSYGLGLLAAFGGQAALTRIGDTLFVYGTIDSGGADLVNLTGRTPLWDELLRYLADRPWAGYGYGAFWNPVFMPDIWQVVGWEAPAAHNGFLDEALATGLIGLVLFLIFWLSGTVLALLIRARRKDPFATLVVATMLFFLVCNVGDSQMQWYARFAFYVPVTALFALLGRHAREERRLPVAPQARWR